MNEQMMTHKPAPAGVSATKRSNIMNITQWITRSVLGVGACLLALSAHAGVSAPLKPSDFEPVATKAAKAIAPIEEKKCYSCHDNIEEFHSGGRHATVNCAACHDAVDHLKSAKEKDMGKRPVTRTDHQVCATCHADQYNSFVKLNHASGARVEKAAFKSRSPLFDKLLEGYGFTIEHNEPRSHAFMLVDHLIVDRAYGGRFQLKDWMHISDAEGAVKGAWNVLTDKEPNSSDQKRFMSQVVTAANPVCLSCKTQDHILDWKYMGDKDPKAKWDRTSKVVDFVRDLKHPLNCFMCHDPHSAAPRVVRDGLIEAVVDRKLGTYPQDPVKSAQITMKKVMFQRDGKDFRAIGMLSKPDSNLMCAQCHVEYNCGPGFDLGDAATGKAPEVIKMSDRRTNLFPWTNVMGYKDVMTKQYNFKDFKHASTGALLPKIQHPEFETTWGSKHERAGVECKDCHMPKVKASADAKPYTWHGQQSSRNMTQDTCAKCHKGWTVEESKYQIDSIQNYIRGKMTKAEFWLAQLIDEMLKAKDKGVDEATMNKAKEYQYDATLYWEWWTAENSDGFHNPEMARASLTKSIDASKDGIKMLKEAMAAKK